MAMIRLDSFRRILVAFFGIFCLVALTTIEAKSSDSEKIQDDLISWVRSKGGSFSDKIEIRRVNPEDPTSYMGVFVREPIEAKESLFVIPRDCFIHVFDTAETKQTNNEADDISYETYNADLCKLANKLMNEMKLGEKSEYAPYVAYLQTQKPGQLPVNWSQQGKDLLRKVAIPGSPMVDWIDWNFRSEANKCIEPKKNESGEISFEEHMVEMTIQRCFDVALIPIWDMVNHDNGRINTENDSMYDEGGMKVRALRKLEKGEELFASYDLCLDCKDLVDYWGTPEILKDFGFVENYPHRWVFSEQEIWIEIWEDYALEDFAMLLYFSGVKNGPPSAQQLEFLKSELRRLESVSLERLTGISDHEFQTIERFRDAAMVDLGAVVDFLTEDYDDDTTDEL